MIGGQDSFTQGLEPDELLDRQAGAAQKGFHRILDDATLSGELFDLELLIGSRCLTETDIDQEQQRKARNQGHHRRIDQSAPNVRFLTHQSASEPVLWNASVNQRRQVVRTATLLAAEDIHPIGKQRQNEIVESHSAGRQPGTGDTGAAHRWFLQVALGIGLHDMNLTVDTLAQIQTNDRLQIQFHIYAARDFTQAGDQVCIFAWIEQPQPLHGDRTDIHRSEDHFALVQHSFDKRERERVAPMNQLALLRHDRTGYGYAVFRPREKFLDQHLAFGGPEDLGDGICKSEVVLNIVHVQ